MPGYPNDDGSPERATRGRGCTPATMKLKDKTHHKNTGIHPTFRLRSKLNCELTMAESPDGFDRVATAEGVKGM